MWVGTRTQDLHAGWQHRLTGGRRASGFGQQQHMNEESLLLFDVPAASASPRADQAGWWF